MDALLRLSRRMKLLASGCVQHAEDRVNAVEDHLPFSALILPSGDLNGQNAPIDRQGGVGDLGIWVKVLNDARLLPVEHVEDADLLARADVPAAQHAVRPECGQR